MENQGSPLSKELVCQACQLRSLCLHVGDSHKLPPLASRHALPFLLADQLLIELSHGCCRDTSLDVSPVDLNGEEDDVVMRMP